MSGISVSVTFATSHIDDTSAIVNIGSVLSARTNWPGLTFRPVTVPAIGEAICATRSTSCVASICAISASVLPKGARRRFRAASSGPSVIEELLSPRHALALGHLVLRLLHGGAGGDHIGIGLHEVRRVDGDERATRSEHIPGFRDEAKDPALEGCVDRRRPVVIEGDPADGGPGVAELTELHRLDSEPLRLQLVDRHRIGV